MMNEDDDQMVREKGGQAEAVAAAGAGARIASVTAQVYRRKNSASERARSEDFDSHLDTVLGSM
jgi:hypothetical protein